MTDLPKEDRDLIERVLGKDEVRWLARIGCNTFSVEMVAKLLAAARSEGRAEAPVVDDAVIAKALQAFNQQSDGAPDGDFTAMRAADEVDTAIALRDLLFRARWYVNDALEAHEHSDGRDLLREIDAALPVQALAALSPAKDEESGNG